MRPTHSSSGRTTPSVPRVGTAFPFTADHPGCCVGAARSITRSTGTSATSPKSLLSRLITTRPPPQRAGELYLDAACSRLISSSIQRRGGARGARRPNRGDQRFWGRGGAVRTVTTQAPAPGRHPRARGGAPPAPPPGGGGGGGAGGR